MKATILISAVVIIFLYCYCQKTQEFTGMRNAHAKSKSCELNVNGSKKNTTLIDSFVETKSEIHTSKGFTICECGWSRKEVVDTIGKIIPHLNAIYHNRLLSNTKLKGELVVRFSIWFKSGTVKSVSLASQKTDDSIFNEEILNGLKLIRFKGIDCQCDSLFVFNYPFVFELQ